MLSSYTGLPVVRALAGWEGPEVVVSGSGDANRPRQFSHPPNFNEGLSSAFCAVLGLGPQEAVLEGHGGPRL